MIIPDQHTHQTHHKRTTCRACESARLLPFLCLGTMPLANAFIRHKSEFDNEPSYPLDVYFCQDCTLVQLLDVINPEVLFREYLYITGTSSTMATHNTDYARTVVDLLQLRKSDLVLEVASNDGSLLSCFRSHGVRTLGVEPASNISELSRAKGIETVNEFFNLDTASYLRSKYGPARAVIGNNVLAHIDHPLGFLQSCRQMVNDDSMVIIEVPYLRDFIDRVEFDTIYHEHLCYFSLMALVRLFESAGLSVIRVDPISVHGGSLRIYATPVEHCATHTPDIMKMIDDERAASLHEPDRYMQFACAVEKCRDKLRTLLNDLTHREMSLAAYGAPAKGNTLLNYCDIGTNIIPYTVDKNPIKVGLYTPGTHLPVLDISTLLTRQPDYTLLLAWNFADEILSQQHTYRDRGGHFIIPIPEPRIV